MAQPERSLQYYQSKAHDNNPVLKQNKNVQAILSLQNDLVLIQNKKLQISLSGDLLFTPGFADRGKFITFSSNYESNPKWGYDGSSTNRTLYAGQVNVSRNLFNKKMIYALTGQNNAYSKTIDLSNRQLIHDIDKTISDQFI